MPFVHPKPYNDINTLRGERDEKKVVSAYWAADRRHADSIHGCREEHLSQEEIEARALAAMFPEGELSEEDFYRADRLLISATGSEAVINNNYPMEGQSFWAEVHFHF